MSFSLKIDNTNIHFIQPLFNALEYDGGMGFSAPSSDTNMDGHIFEVIGFDLDGDLVIQCDKKERTIARHVLSQGTIFTKKDPAPILTAITARLDQEVKRAIDRFHVEREFRIGDRVRFIPSLTVIDAPNAALFIVEIARDDHNGNWPPADFSSPRQDVVLGYYRYDGAFIMFPTDSRRLEMDKPHPTWNVVRQQ